jgi:hypothetical protein
MPAFSASVFFVKFSIIASLSALGGYLVSADSHNQYKKGQDLTLEKHIANYDDHRAELMLEPISTLVGVILLFCLSLIFLCVYETVPLFLV